MSIGPGQRHKRARPCMVCGGGDDDPRGRERRCDGFTSEDGKYVHCTREDHAGLLEPEANGRTYVHFMNGSCRCGEEHGSASSGYSADVAIYYDYRDARGQVVFQVVRKPGKKFLQRRPLGGGEWEWSIKGVQRLPYRLPELARAPAGSTVYIVEGEKDADAMWSVGMVATCNPGGAGKWNTVDDVALPYLRDKHVIVVGDADKPGRLHALDVARYLDGHVESLALVECPSPHKDVSDYLATGGVIDVHIWQPLQDPTPESVKAPVVAAEKTPDRKEDRWNLMSTEQLFAPLPEYPWLMKGMHLAPGRVTLLAGYANSGKTIVAQSIAISIATGHPLWNKHAPARAGKVLHLNGEVSSFIARERYQRLVNGSSIAMASVVSGGRLVLANYPRVALDDKNFEKELAEQVRGYELVIVDSLRAFSGALDENAKEIGVALFMLARVSELTGVTFLVLHHTKKAGKQGEGPVNMSEMISGSSSIFGGSECAFVLQGEKGEPVTVHHERSPVGRTMSDFGLRFDDITMHGQERWGLRLTVLDRDDLDDAKDEANSRRLEWKEKQTTKTTAKRIAETIYNEPGHVFRGSAEKLRQKVGGKTDTFHEVFKKCIDTGAVVRSPGHNNPVFSIGTIDYESES